MNTITGIDGTGATEGRVVVIQASNYDTIFVHNDTGENAGDRFRLPGDRDLFVEAGSSVTFYYGEWNAWEVLWVGGGDPLSHFGPPSLGDGGAGQRQWDDNSNLWYWSPSQYDWYAESEMSSTVAATGVSAASTDYPICAGVAASKDVLIDSFAVGFKVTGTNNGSNYWTFDIYKATYGSSSLTQVAAGSLNTSANGGTNWYYQTDAVDSGPSAVAYFLRVAKVNSPGDIDFVATVLTRLYDNTSPG